MRISDWSSDVCSSDLSTIMSVNNTLYCNGLLKSGSEEQKHKYVTPIASGAAIGAYALTEPQSGSDAVNMRTRALLSADGSHYVVNGKKSWITSGPVAKYIMLFAVTDASQGAKGIRSEERRVGKEWVSTGRYGG